MRGEYRVRPPVCGHPGELPPRARRIRGEFVNQLHATGTTSACAENTGHTCRLVSTSRNYLRVRGEYGRKNAPYQGEEELPPRARRIRGTLWRQPPQHGTTSACAENTHGHSMNPIPAWNYLRVRGEYGFINRSRGVLTELPPRARRIHITVDGVDHSEGTTSACAENTC